MATTTNKKELKYLIRKSVIKELIERTKSCTLIWDDLGKGLFIAKLNDFTFYISRYNYGAISIDVLKKNKIYQTYNSNIDAEVGVLYEEVDNMVNIRKILKLKNLNNELGKLSDCNFYEEENTHDTHNIVASGGILVRGSPNENAIYEISTYGNFSISGSSDVNATYQIEVSNGIMIAGDSDVEVM